MEPVRDLSIAQQALKCLTLFERLLELQDEQESSKNDSSQDALINEQTRLRTWIENNGVLQRGEASLDHQLRHADKRLTVLDDLRQLYIDLDEMWQISLGARAQQTRTSLDDVASRDLSNTEGSDDDNNGEDVPRLVELLVAQKADTEKLEIYHQMGVRNLQRTQARATSPKDSANRQSKMKDCIETEGATPLHRAALQGDVESIKAALKEGADIEGSSQDGATPLMFAASKGHYYAIKKLLASRANINAVSTKGWTALRIAVRRQDARTVKQLTRNGADTNHLSPGGWTALNEASYQGQKAIIRILLQGGADTELRSPHDWTPLMQACHKGDEAAVRLLHGAGANMEATSAHHETAILLAAGGGHTNIVRMLLKYGCAPEPSWAKNQNNNSNEVSQKAKARRTREPEDKVHVRGLTPLMFASQGGHVEIAQLLLERNVNTEARSPHGKTALEIARENERIDMVLILEFARDTMSWWQDQLDAAPGNV